MPFRSSRRSVTYTAARDTDRPVRRSISSTIGTPYASPARCRIARSTICSNSPSPWCGTLLSFCSASVDNVNIVSKIREHSAERQSFQIDGIRFIGTSAYERSLTFAREAGYRIVGDVDHDAFSPAVVILPDGRFRLYLTDQRVHIGDIGAPAFISAISTDGLSFTWENGTRLTYTGTGNEAGGIRAPSVVLLPNGTWRMYYAGLLSGASRAGVLLSATSQDGLTWTREAGVRLDMTTLCPASSGNPNPKAFLDHSGTFHVFTAAVACDDMNHTNEALGIFEGTSTDGLNFNFSRVPVVQGYYIKSLYHGNPTDPFENVEDPMLVVTPAGLRMYFACGNTSTPTDVWYYSVTNATLF
jgi:hypothetical protein